ncbi:MAG: hypothetical protein ACLP7P_01525 [Rhodomicrobium sp.]
MTGPSGDYYFVSYNAKMESKRGRLLPVRATSVPGSEFTNALKLLSGNALFFFDTCFAGDATESGLDYNKLINGVAGKANAIVFASSTGAELSHERATIGSTAPSPRRCSMAWLEAPTTTTMAR